MKCLPTWRAEGDLQLDGEHIEHVKFCPDCFYIEVGRAILAGLGISIVATGSFFQYVAYGVGERLLTAGNRGKLISCHTFSPFLRECNLSTGRVWEIASVEINQNLPDIFVFAVVSVLWLSVPISSYDSLEFRKKIVWCTNQPESSPKQTLELRMHPQLVLHNKKETIGSVNQESMHVLNEVVTGALQQPILSE